MRRAFMCSLTLTAALIGAIAAYPASAQERGAPRAGVERTAPDLSVIAQRLRDRGLSESQIGDSIARIRAAIASGNYPNLERRLNNSLNPNAGTGGRPAVANTASLARRQ